MKIIVADDHALIGEGIISFFEENAPDFEVSFAKNKSKLIYLLKEESFDIIIQDVQFGEVDAREIIQEIRIIQPNIKIVALSSHIDAFTVKSVLATGVNSYVSKTSPLDELILAVKETLNDVNYISKDIRENIANSFLSDEKDSAKIRLTKRELEVLDGIQNELSTKEIAAKLFISEKTIEGYRSSLLMKFQVKNVAGLMKKAILQGYIK